MSSHIHKFLFPKLNRRLGLRVAIVAFLAYASFGYICLPMKVRGISMVPTYHDRGFNFCWRPAAWFQTPQRGDVVMIRYAGKRVALFKRIVGMPGDSIAFKSGVLFRNNEPVDEPYVKGPCDWNLDVRVVSPDCVYVVGDNRSVDRDMHLFGEVKSSRILGVPLW